MVEFIGCEMSAEQSMMVEGIVGETSISLILDIPNRVFVERTIGPNNWRDNLDRFEINVETGQVFGKG